MNISAQLGRLAKDPECSQTQSGISVARFTIAVDRDYKDKSTGKYPVDFIDCTAWRYTAEFILKYFSQGDKICVSGRLQTESYDDRNGIRRKRTYVLVENADFAGKHSSDGSNYSTGYSDSNYPEPAAPAQQQFTELPADDESYLPF